MAQTTKFGQYRVIEKVGYGSFGQVYRCEWKKKIVALKRMELVDLRVGHWGVSQSGYREIGAFCILDPGHDNVVQMFESFVENYLFICMEYGQENLRKYLQRTKNLLMEIDRSDLKRQLLKGTGYIHSKSIIHRDLKPENIVMVNGKVLKIVAFGLSKIMANPCFDFSKDVQTLPYRDIDVLFGATHYSLSVDIWSNGCIMGEIYGLSHPLFSHVNLCVTCNEHGIFEQPMSIMVTLGLPTEERWPGITARRRFGEVLLICCNHLVEKTEDTICTSLYEMFCRCGVGGMSTISLAGVEIMTKMLRYDPSQRPSVKEILDFLYFKG